MTADKFPSIDGVYETHLPVADLSRSIDFYQNVLGLQLAHEFPKRCIAFFWVGGKNQGMLGLWQAGHGPLKMTLHFAFKMQRDDVVSAVALLKKNKVAPLGFDGELVDEPVVIGWMPAMSLYLKDPDGHSIEFIHLLDDAADDDFGVQPYSAWLTRRK